MGSKPEGERFGWGFGERFGKAKIREARNQPKVFKESSSSHEAHMACWEETMSTSPWLVLSAIRRELQTLSAGTCRTLTTKLWIWPSLRRHRKQKSLSDRMSKVVVWGEIKPWARWQRGEWIGGRDKLGTGRAMKRPLQYSRGVVMRTWARIVAEGQESKGRER